MFKAILITMVFSLLSCSTNTSDAALRETDKQSIREINILRNPGFEARSADWSGTGSSTLAMTTTTAQVGEGKISAEWDASAASEFLNSTAITVPGVLKGNSCDAIIYYKDGDANVELQAFDGSSILAQTTLSTATNYTKAKVTFNCPTTGTVQLRLASTANAALIRVDKAYLGESELGGASAAVVAVAHIQGAGGCTWSTTSATFADFATVAACPGPTVVFEETASLVSTTDTDLPQFTFTNLPAGKYLIRVNGPWFLPAANTGDNNLRLSDGTTNTGHTGLFSSTTNDSDYSHVEGFFNYGSSGTRTIKVQGMSAAATTSIGNGTSNRRLTMVLIRYP